MFFDVNELPVESVKKRVMRILASPSFGENLKTYGIAGGAMPGPYAVIAWPGLSFV